MNTLGCKKRCGNGLKKTRFGLLNVSTCLQGAGDRGDCLPLRVNFVDLNMSNVVVDDFVFMVISQKKRVCSKKLNMCTKG